MPLELEGKLRELSLFPPTTMPVLSVYIDARPDQHGRDNFGPFLRKEFKARGATYPMRSKERASFERDAERIMSWLGTELRPSSNGAALFACEASGLFEALQFDAPFQSNQLYVYHQPHLYTLAKLLDRYRPYAAVIADTNSARIFVFGLARTVQTDRITNPKVRSRSIIEGWWLRRFQLKVENDHLRHAKQVIEHLDRIVREEKIDRILFAGDEVILSVLREQISPLLASKVVDELKLDMTAPEHEILRTTVEVIQEESARTDAERVRAMIDDYRAGGLAAVGIHDVLAALSNGQADTVFISSTLEQVHPGEEVLPSALVPELAGLPAGTRVQVTDALVTRAYQTGAQVSFIEEPGLLENVGGVGASLRYRL
ncbi:MAG: host attachment protein [Acidobacteriaceae bacterium]